VLLRLAPATVGAFYLRKTSGDPLRLVAGEQLLPAFAIIVPERDSLSGSTVMEWLKGKTSIAGYQISNWLIVLGAIIIVLLIFQNLH
jgi:hypothetical protein